MLDVEMSLKRCAAKHDMEARWANDMDQGKRRLRKVQASLWKYVKHTVPELPRMMVDGPLQLSSGATVGPYELGHLLGSGMTGQVFACKNNNTGRISAMKAIPKSEMDSIESIRAVLEECQYLQLVKHPNIAECYGVTHIRQFLVIHLEFCGKQNLFRYTMSHSDSTTGRLPLPQATRIMSQVATAVAYCHSQGVAHCDLKPENIVMDEEGVPKLVDFGVAVGMDQMCHGYCGTVVFMAPEIFTEEAYQPGPADVWACGVLMLEMFCGFGKLNRMANWPTRPDPEPGLAQDLHDLFADDRASACIIAALEEDQVAANDDVVRVFTQFFQVVPATRWTMVQFMESNSLSC